MYSRSIEIQTDREIWGCIILQGTGSMQTSVLQNKHELPSQTAFVPGTSGLSRELSHPEWSLNLRHR